jgi:hypothetical protein
MTADNKMHTPGPWKRCRENRGGCECGQVWDASGKIHVATAEYAHVQSFDEARANVRLIAAAPDMLAALKEIELCAL